MKSNENGERNDICMGIEVVIDDAVGIGKLWFSKHVGKDEQPLFAEI